jgi:hypothetical protein
LLEQLILFAGDDLNYPAHLQRAEHAAMATENLGFVSTKYIPDCEQLKTLEIQNDEEMTR